MTPSLHEVLSDIATDVSPVDLLDRVRGETRAMRLRRRAVVAATFVAVVGVAIGGVVIASPGHDPSAPATHTSPSTEVPALPAQVDLTTATTGTLDVASMVFMSDGALYAYDAFDKRVVQVPLPPGRTVGTPMLSADGSHIAVARYLSAVEEDPPQTATASPGMPGVSPVAVVDVRTGELEVYDGASSNESRAGIALSPDGSQIVSIMYALDADGGWVGLPRIDVTNVSTGVTASLPFDPVPSWHGEEDPLTSIAWSPNGAYLALDNSVVIDAVTGATVTSLGNLPPLALGSPWSPDSTQLLRQENAVGIWPALPPTSRPVASMPILGIPLGFARTGQVLWADDHNGLFVTTGDGTRVGATTQVISSTAVTQIVSSWATAGQ